MANDCDMAKWTGNEAVVVRASDRFLNWIIFKILFVSHKMPTCVQKENLRTKKDVGSDKMSYGTAKNTKC